MTKDEIKKALECCISADGNSCKTCPYLFYENCKSGAVAVQDALNLITEQEEEIKQLKAEYKQLNTNAEILARGVRDLNHENYELTEKVKQSKIDVLNKAKEKLDSAPNGWAYTTYIDEMIEELQK